LSRTEATDSGASSGALARFGREAVRSGPIRFVPKTLATRLALTYSMLVLAVMAALGWTLVQTIRGTYLEQLERDLTAEATLAGELISVSLAPVAPSPRPLEATVAELAEGLSVRVTVVDGEGRVLADSHRDPGTMENHATRPEIQDAFWTGSGTNIRFSTTTSTDFLFVAVRRDDLDAVIRLGVPVAEVDRVLQGIQGQVAAAAILGTVLMSGAGWFVARRIGEGLDAVRRQASAVASGRFDVEVEPALTKELGDLGRTFNAMTEQLRESHSQLNRMRVRIESTLANLSDGVVLIDERGYVLLANPSARAMLAIRGERREQPFVEVARDHELSEMVAAALAQPDSASERIIRHSRSGRILQAVVRGIAAEEERVGLLVLRDVTELRRLETVRREFVANVSHELRTPLTSIRALVETLEAGAIEDPEVSADFMARIIAEVDRLAALVDELLDLARLESGRLQLSNAPVDPESLLRRAVERMALQIERAGLRVEFDVAPGTPHVLVDANRIDQVLLNLIHNAIKFTPRGGVMTLSASRANEFVEFRVRDTGLGVSPEDLPRLFERFFKTDKARRSEGTGLGLAIAKHIVLAHEGEIWAEPNVDRGTTFVFTVPLAVSGLPVSAETATPALAATGAGVERVLKPVAENVEGEYGER
jgi:two-component system phosphate regulon sensor histidine kinase PhoR